jgi:hypothetical protein
VQKSWGLVPNLHRVLAESPAALEAYATLWGIAEKTGFTPQERNIVYIAIILDNLNTHKKNEHWLTAHPNVKFHFTPTSASWLNQVEVWFSILQGAVAQRRLLTSLKQLQEHIDAYINAYTKRLSPSSGPRKKSVNADSKAAVSLSSDSGY